MTNINQSSDNKNQNKIQQEQNYIEEIEEQTEEIKETDQQALKQNTNDILKNITLIDQSREQSLKIYIFQACREKNDVKICSFNSNGLQYANNNMNKSKLSQIYKFTTEQNVDILCIQETKSNSEKKFEKINEVFNESGEEYLNNYISCSEDNQPNNFSGTITSVNKNGIINNKINNCYITGLNNINYNKNGVYDLNTQLIFNSYLQQGRLIFLLYQMNKCNLLIINLYQYFFDKTSIPDYFFKRFEYDQIEQFNSELKGYIYEITNQYNINNNDDDFENLTIEIENIIDDKESFKFQKIEEQFKKFNQKYFNTDSMYAQLVNQFENLAEQYHKKQLKDFYDFLPNLTKQIKQKLIDDKKIEQKQEFKVILCGNMNQKDLIIIPNVNNYEKNLDQNNNEKWKYLTNTYYLSNKFDEDKFVYNGTDREKYITQRKDGMIDYIFIDNYQNINIDWKLYDAKQQGITTRKINHNYMIVTLTFNDKQNIQYYNGNTIAMVLAYNGIVPPKQYEHISNLQNDNGMIVAMFLASKGIIPPKQWQHDPNIKCRDFNYTVRQYLQSQYLPIPNEWYDDEYKDHKKKPDYLNNILNGIKINESNNVDPKEQYEFGWTIAMIYVHQGIIPPQYWEHNPDLQNYNKETVAMLLAKNKIIDIPQQWQHDTLIKNIYGNTVAMIYASQGIIPPQQWYHDPLLQNDDKYTVGLLLAKNGIIPPQCWNHEPTLQDNKGYTVAIYLAQNGIIPPSYWNHNPNIVNKDQKTVYDYLSQKHKKIPKQWLIKNLKMSVIMIYVQNGQILYQEQKYNSRLKDKYNKAVQDFLEQNKIKVPKQQKIN